MNNYDETLGPLLNNNGFNIYNIRNIVSIQFAARTISKEEALQEIKYHNHHYACMFILESKITVMVGGKSVGEVCDYWAYGSDLSGEEIKRKLKMKAFL